MGNKNMSIDELKKDEFLEAFERDGYVIAENVFPAAFITQVRSELEDAIQKEAQAFPSSNSDYGKLLACPVYGGKFLDVLENRKYVEPFNWILGDTCIIWVYTSTCMPPNSGNYTSRIHVDRPHFTAGFMEGAGSLILLDDFTEDNGATYFLPGSQKMPEQPSEEYFYTHAKRLIAPKGSVFYFNLRLWHAGGTNTTSQWRNALGIGMIRPYIKQRIDLPRALENVDLSGTSVFAKQKLGFFAQPPVSLAQFYNNAETRKLQKSEWDNT
jgi:ectoine hydroxylase-related dioxygenase (phytanoyl-CoA dioxygenase family)